MGDTGYPSCSGDPPCLPLLVDDPLLLVRDKARCPTHLCVALAECTTERWAAVTSYDERIPASEPASSAWARAHGGWTAVWPLPVGARAILDWARMWECSEWLENTALVLTAPFDGDEQAYFARRIRVGGQLVDCLGLRESAGEWRDAVANLWALPDELKRSEQALRLMTQPSLPGRAGTMVVRPVNSEPLTREAQRAVDPVRRWWARYIAGLPLRMGGRPRLEDAEWSGWREVAEQATTFRSEHPRYTWDQIAARLEMPPSTLKKWLQRLRKLRS